jgi:hypothetical protein
MRRVLPCLLTLILLAVSPSPASDPGDNPVREPILAGTWYPAAPQALREMAGSLLARAAPPEVPGRLLGLVVPHAGYVYSGRTAAQAFKLLEGQRFDSVVLVGPSHFLAFDGVAVHDQGDFKTPLGVVPLDRDLIRALAAKDAFIRPLPEAHAREHSLEIELPLLQTAMPGFKLVPLVMGSQDAASCRRLAAALAAACTGKSVLLVASSDLSHFHDEHAAQGLDAVFAGDVAAYDVDKLLADLDAGRCEACGGGPVAAVMLAARALGADSATVLAQTTSAAATGDRSRVVGYLAAAFSAAGRRTVAPPTPDRAKLPASFTDDEKAALRAIAKNAIQAALEHKRVRPPQAVTPALAQKRGAFVTLTINGELRGCIGRIEADRPLHEVVAAMAQAAAFEDPRFAPLTAGEFNHAAIEISVLTLPAPVADPGQIQPGRDGIIMRRFPHSGLLLPQVARQYGWDRDTFLSETCLKAGMKPDCWKDKRTEIFSFSAEVF